MPVAGLPLSWRKAAGPPVVATSTIGIGKVGAHHWVAPIDLR
jgi:hypothetical protein